jgi:uncharacterized protein (TIGR03083 family)
MATDRELVEMQGEVWASIEALGAQLDEAGWATPTECPGWTVQDNLVHVTAIESLILERPLPTKEPPDPLPHVKNDTGKANERWVEARRSWTGAEAFAEFRAVTGERIASLRALDEAGFGADSWTPMGPGTVRQLLGFRIFDSWVHEQDMRRAVGHPGDLDSAAAAEALTMMCDVMPYVVGKKVGAQDGCTVVFMLTGPLTRSFAVGVVDGRARPLDDLPDPPTVQLTMDTETFTRLACGRFDPAESLVTGGVAIEGDVELGGQIVHQLNYMF